MPGGQNAMAHLKKRKLEAESGLGTALSCKSKGQLVVSPSVSGGVGVVGQDMENPDATAKRRRKSVRDDDVRKPMESESSVAKSAMSLPKKRVFAVGNSGSPARKTNKNSEEPEDDETLIRETEAALKSLSGSWPGPSGSLYQRGNSDDDRYESNFENLFEEKKDSTKMSPSPVSTSSTASNEAGCSLKDVITFRGQQDRGGRCFQQSRLQDHGGKIQQQHQSGLVHDPSKIGRSLANSRLSSRDRNDRGDSGQLRQSDKYSRYDPPDFNELVDDSSNELEIDMSDPMADKEDSDREKDRGCKSNASSPHSSSRHQHQQQPQHQQHHSQAPHHLSYSGYHRQYAESSLKGSSVSGSAGSSPTSSGGSTFSGSSAFRPPNTDHSKAACRGPTTVGATSSPPIGPYPASATFVGFPTPVPVPVMPQPIVGIASPPDEKHPSSLLQLKSPKEDNIHGVAQTSMSSRATVAEVTTPAVTNSGVSVSKQQSNAIPPGGLPPVESPDANSSKQYTILQPAGVGSRAASAIQDIAREGVVSVAAVSSSSTTNNTGNANNTVTTSYSAAGNGHSVKASSNVNRDGSQNSSSQSTSNSSSNVVAVASGGGSNGSSGGNNTMTTTMTTTTTTACPAAVGDVSTTTGVTIMQDNGGMKVPDSRNLPFDPTRPGMSMSPSSLNRGERNTQQSSTLINPLRLIIAPGDFLR